MSDYMFGGPILEDITCGAKSFGEFCQMKLLKLGDKVMIINGLTSDEITASQLLSQSINLAESLSKYGIRSGDNIAVCSENRVEYYYVTFASFFIGATIMPICTTLLGGELQHALNFSFPKIIFCDNKNAEKMVKMAEINSFIQEIIVFGDDLVHANSKSYNSFVSNNKEVKIKFDCEPQDLKNSVLAILSSSGTTGSSKGVEQSHWSLMAHMASLSVFINEQVLCAAPFSMGFGFILMLELVLNDSTLFMLPKFDEINYLRCIQTFKIKNLIVNPRVYVMLAKSPLVMNYNLSSVKHIVNVGGSVSTNLINLVGNRLNDVKLTSLYGLTECGQMLNHTDEFCNIESLGVLSAGVWGKIVDPETHKMLDPYEHGEFMFKADTIMKAYVRNAAATEIAFDKDGFFYTGDIGYYNDNKEWFLIGRTKEIIKYRFYHVPPLELETILLTHPNVHEACVVGLPDESFGELPLAFVVKIGDVSEQELVDYVAERISDPKHLRGGVRFIDEIPKSAAGKILRRLLKNSLIVKKS